MPDYLVRLAQTHESFRRPELEALAQLANIDLTVVQYDETVCAIKRGKTAIHFTDSYCSLRSAS